MPTALKVLARNFRKAAKTDDSKPFNTLLLRALRVLRVLIDRHAEFGHGFTLLGKTSFRRVSIRVVSPHCNNDPELPQARSSVLLRNIALGQWWDHVALVNAVPIRPRANVEDACGRLL